MPGATRTDGTETFAEGESFKTGSRSKKDRLEAFVDWLLTPENQRVPRTKKAWAEQWGVGSQTVRNDLREPFVQRELASRARALARVDRLPAILDNLTQLATANLSGGDSEAATPAAAQVAAARVLLDWMSKTESLREADLDIQDLSDEQLVAAAIRFLEMADDSEAT